MRPREHNQIMRTDIENLKQAINSWLDNLLAVDGDSMAELKFFQSGWEIEATTKGDEGEIHWRKSKDIE